MPLDPPAPTVDAACRGAMQAIEQLADPSATRALALTSGDFDWLPTAGGYVRDLAYDLLHPVALAILRRGSGGTRIDLLEVAADAPTMHYEVARMNPYLVYEPSVAGWRSARYRDPRRHWMQGLTADQLGDRVATFLTVRNREHAIRLATREEFKAEFDRVLTVGTSAERRSLGVLVNPLLGFSIEERPVFWRVLAVQYAAYSSLLGAPTSSVFDGETMPIAHDVLASALA